jgi:hypothetical protein
MTRLSRILLGAAIIGLTPACAGVQTSTRPGAALPARDATLVEVRTTGYDGAYDVVSFSSWDVELNETLPETAPEDVLFNMRAAAATHGAELLLVERWEDPYRKAFYGVGAAKRDGEPAALATCAHAGFEEKLKSVRKSARACAKAIKARRPAIRGVIEAVFEVAPEGDTLRAAATPASSRDSELQACVIEPIYKTNWGDPSGFTCKGSITVDLSALK